ncbi:MAG: hypothetical protein OEO23_02290, partial [Gemmatimonadota bacterium]|nr:hypothetical protein [Gemmatimonadota bacterium]
QEQHPDRAALFMQWKEMGWPLMVDSYNLLEAPYVPISLALDEHGVIQQVLRPLEDVGVLDEAFLSSTFDKALSEPPAAATPPDLEALRARAQQGDSGDWLAYGNALATWGPEGRIDAVVGAFSRVVEDDPENGWAQFRLGVAHRARYDSPAREPADFQEAVDHWSAALALDPNQYIWRRRIQQYGPRLDKPYPFYDWVVQAREEIAARGEEPLHLAVEPRGAEFAEPAREFVGGEATVAEPDPQGRVLRDDGDFITLESTAVPSEVGYGEVARFHLVFRPIAEKKAHWNNEAEEMVLWVDPPRGWDVESHMLTHPLPPEVVSQEERIIEVELRAPERSLRRTATIPAYALYYVCEDVNGICMYRRQDVELTARIRRR